MLANPCKCSSSFPPGRARFLVVGPLSLEWLHDHIHGDAGVISSTRTKSNGKIKVFVGS